jgi:diguanylate cyclase (GGDEF)-like protein
MKTLILGMKNLAAGNLHSRINYQNIDEFSDMAQNFNHMTESLECITIKKEALKEEVARQTHKLTEQQIKLTYLAEHDELTSIYNRRAFIKQIDLAIARDSRSQQQAALLFIDLDRFKIINDTMGHQTGDEVLIHIAKRLMANLRSSDFAGRLGGDEFVVWLDFIDNSDDIITKTQQILAVLKQPIKIAEETVNVGASIGISQFPAHGNNSLTLITAADSAMYIAKHDPQKEYCFFEDIH